MVLGHRSKSRKDVSFHVGFNIFIQEISPWPPSESLKSLRSVVLLWENGERNSGKTNAVAPSIGSGATVGKIEFNEFMSLHAVFQKEGSSKSGKWQKNILELNLYEPRRDKLKGQHLGTATLDLAEHVMFHEDTSVLVPLNSKRSLRNNVQPMVHLQIQPLDEDSSSVSSRDALSKHASVDSASKELMSATTSEEYTEDAEFASFTDDDEEAPYPHHSDGDAPTGSNRSQESLKVMEQCIARLDVAMFNAILRESDDEIPTDPMSDPINDPKVLPIPSGKFSFGAGVQLKNAIGSWSRCLTDLFGMDMDDYPEVESENSDNGAAELLKPFYLLNALSDLLMLPKDVLMETSSRKELCPTFSSSIIKRILDGFVADDFCPDPVQHSLLEALELEDHLEGNTKGIQAVPCSASPILYPCPASGAILSMIGDPRKSGSAILRKSNTSDDELDELSSPLTFISKASSSPLAKVKQIGNPNTARYRLLHDVWKLDNQ